MRTPLAGLGPVVVLALLASLTAALAQPSSQPPPELARLQALIGEWEVVERFEPPKGEPREGAGVLTVTPGPRRQAIVLTYRSTGGPMKGFELMELLSWDPAARRYQMAYVTGFQPGMTFAVGDVVDGDIVFNREEQRGDAVRASRSVISDLKDGRFTLSSYEGTPGGPLRRTLVLSCVRRSQ